MLTVVLTTIQQPTGCVVRLAETLQETDARLVVAGDAKGPADFVIAGQDDCDAQSVVFLDLETQLRSTFGLAQKLPTGHYCRKNVGYLQAIADGATCIYETDDDNAPLASWKPRSEDITGVASLTSTDERTPSWVNVYRHFSEGNIWPRGLPLDRIQSEFRSERTQPDLSHGDGRVWAPLQQGLADGSPDVDAIWRLVLDREFTFEKHESVLLPPGQWCPFNSQSTWWWPAVYPLMYIPSYCSFRMCDIWRSFVAQRCLWELDAGVVFHPAEVYQERNPHDLMRDFNDEVPGYQTNGRIASILEDTALESGEEEVAANLHRCFEALVRERIFPSDELGLVDAWVSDLAKLRRSSNG